MLKQCSQSTSAFLRLVYSFQTAENKTGVLQDKTFLPDWVWRFLTLPDSLQGWLLSQELLHCLHHSLVFGVCPASVVVDPGSQLSCHMTPAGSSASVLKHFRFCYHSHARNVPPAFCVLSSWEAHFKSVFLSLVMWWTMGSLIVDFETPAVASMPCLALLPIYRALKIKLL